MEQPRIERAFEDLTASQRAEAELQTSQFVAHLLTRGIRQASGSLPVVLQDGSLVLTPYAVSTPTEATPTDDL